jgi:hypothetical protein
LIVLPRSWCGHVIGVRPRSFVTGFTRPGQPAAGVASTTSQLVCAFVKSPSAALSLQLTAADVLLLNCPNVACHVHWTAVGVLCHKHGTTWSPVMGGQERPVVKSRGSGLSLPLEHGDHLAGVTPELRYGHGHDRAVPAPDGTSPASPVEPHRAGSQGQDRLRSARVVSRGGRDLALLSLRNRPQGWPRADDRWSADLRGPGAAARSRSAWPGNEIAVSSLIAVNLRA